ncbi:MAG: hypothetical protein AB7E47_14935 [Desulfovibrionaceae bacterium]
MDQWPYAKRIMHLIGGLRAVNEAGERRLYVLPQAKEGIFEVTLESYSALYKVVSQLGLTGVGVEFIKHVREVEGAMPPEWRPWFSDRSWLVWENKQAWAEISNSAHQKKQFKCADIARRIRSEIDTCQHHLLRLSKAYNQCLAAKINSNEFRANQPFDDLFSQDIFDFIHSFLSSMGTLRDYLAEYIAEFIIAKVPSKVRQKKKMAALADELKELTHSGKPLREYLLEITSRELPYGWLAVLNEYRNIIIHQSPITDMHKRRYLWQQTIVVNGATLPIILFPIPEDPISISKKRRQKDFYDSPGNTLWATFDTEMNPREPDALLYCHQSLGNMMDLAKKVIDLSPCKPEPIVITPIGEVVLRSS